MKIDGSAPTGQILIGHGSNGDFAKGTLTAGEGIDVTITDGSITIELVKMQLQLIKVLQVLLLQTSLYQVVPLQSQDRWWNILINHL